MTPHTIKNLREVEDAAPGFGLAPAVQARFAARDLGMERSAISLQRLAPNVTQPFGHRHKGQEELYVVLAGSGRVKLDAVRVAPEVMRAFSAGPDGLEFLAYGAPAVVEPMKDVEMQQGWWGEGASS